MNALTNARVTVVSPVVLAVVLSSTIACAGRMGARCEPAITTMVYHEQPVYRDCGVDQQARPQTPTGPLQFTASGPTPCYRATIEFVVDANGTPVLSTARAVLTNDSTYYRSIVSSLGPQRWYPATKNKQPVHQLVQMKGTMRATNIQRGLMRTRCR